MLLTLLTGGALNHLLVECLTAWCCMPVFLPDESGTATMILHMFVADMRQVQQQQDEFQPC